MTQTTRRQFLATSAGAAALGLSGQLAFMSSSQAADLREKGYYTYKIGDIEVTSIYDGIWEKAHDDGFIRNATVDETKAALEKAGL
ncbi:MAG: twin-arginine translocation signal domain-containing protein, partial [Pseudomonadota bacterium]